MNTYVVAYYSNWTGELKQAVVEADTVLSAYKTFLANREGKEDAEWFFGIETAEDLEEQLFNMEDIISAIKIN